MIGSHNLMTALSEEALSDATGDGLRRRREPASTVWQDDAAVKLLDDDDDDDGRDDEAVRETPVA